MHLSSGAVLQAPLSLTWEQGHGSSLVLRQVSTFCIALGQASTLQELSLQSSLLTGATNRSLIVDISKNKNMRTIWCHTYPTSRATVERLIQRGDFSRPITRKLRFVERDADMRT